MAELLKDMYNYESLHEIAKRIQSVYHPFQVDEFLKSTMDQSWDDLELKARVRKISSNLGRYLPADYGDALAILDQVVSTCSSNFFGILFPDFVEVYGQDEKNWNLSSLFNQSGNVLPASWRKTTAPAACGEARTVVEKKKPCPGSKKERTITAAS